MKAVIFVVALLFSVDLARGVDGEPLIGACCSYSEGSVDCSQTTAIECVPSLDVPKFWTFDTECGECPKDVPAEAFCRCGDDCCPFTSGVGEASGFLIGSIVLAGLFLLTCTACVMFGPVRRIKQT